MPQGSAQGAMGWLGTSSFSGTLGGGHCFYLRDTARNQGCWVICPKETLGLWGLIPGATEAGVGRGSGCLGSAHISSHAKPSPV